MIESPTTVFLRCSICGHIEFSVHENAHDAFADWAMGFWDMSAICPACMLNYSFAKNRNEALHPEHGAHGHIKGIKDNRQYWKEQAREYVLGTHHLKPGHPKFPKGGNP